jgi:Na+/pantothenate symporter
VVQKVVPAKNIITAIVRKDVRNVFALMMSINCLRNILSSFEIDAAVKELYKAIMKDIYKKYEDDNTGEIQKLKDEKENINTLKNE